MTCEDKERMGLELEEFEKLKTELDVLEEELHSIHAEWIKIHQEGGNIAGQRHQQRHQELMTREIEILKKVKQALDSTVKIIGSDIR